MSILKNIKFDLVFLILFVVYTISAFFMFPNKDNLFWGSYVFTIIAFIIQFLIAYAVTNKNEKSYFNTLPIFTISIFYLFIQIFVSIILMNYSSKIGFNYSIVIQTILLGIFLIIEILLLQSKEHIENVEAETVNRTMFLDEIKKEIQILSNETDGEIKNSIDDLYDTARYCNPMSNKEVISLEKEFLSNLNQLKIEVANKNIENVSNICYQLKKILLDRDTILKN